MYFKEFASFAEAVDTARTFTINVTLIDGTVVSSSPVPKISVAAVTEEIEEIMLAKGVWTMWNHQRKAVAIIPFDQIRLIELHAQT